MFFKVLVVLGIVFCLCFSVSASCEVIDRIMAVVNEEVITLTDVRIVEAFGIHERQNEERAEQIPREILDRLISQKLVIQLTDENVRVGEEELESALREVIRSIDPQRAERSLLQFGLDWDDLKSYIREKILYEKIIAQRFGQRVRVGIEEIEAYYEQVYVPGQRRKGMEPQPMIEILDEIEAAIKKEKITDQVQEWVKNLRREASIQMKLEGKK